MVKALVKCPECKSESDLTKYRLQEAATLICPNCGAEFSLTATLETLPDGAGEEPLEVPPMDEPEFEMPPPPTPEPAMPTPSAEEPPREAVRRPVIRAQVLACSNCRTDWVGVHAEQCPFCDSRSVLASTKSLQERAEDALQEVARGVPYARAIQKLLGRRTRKE